MVENEKNLTPKEKVLLMKTIFNKEKDDETTVKNLSNYLSESYSKLDGFDYRWSTLITNTPLLFEDVDYVRCKRYVIDEITTDELQAYKDGKLREIYATFESMLMCNLPYYSRIMSFCTISFLKYIRYNDELYSEHLSDIPYIFEMTPTQIWCAAMTSFDSTEWELNYAWKINNNNFNFKYIQNKSLFESNYDLIYKNQHFKKFVQYAAFRNDTQGFRQTFFSDITQNRYLSTICRKFTNTSTALSEDQLASLNKYAEEINIINDKLYYDLFRCMKNLFLDDESQFAIYVYNTEFVIHSTKFSMKVSKNIDGQITKEYLANSYECFAAEEYLYPSIKTQMEWAKYKIPAHYGYDQTILKNLLHDMLKKDFREIICIKRMNNFGVLSKIKFSGVFRNVYIDEELMFNNTIIRSTKICLSKKNASQYIINRGYYVFGLSQDVYKIGEITKDSLMNHYSQYCIPVLSHMADVIKLYNKNKNEIIDILCNNGNMVKTIKLSNDDIKYATVKGDVNPRKIMSDIQYNILNKQRKSLDFKKRTYWQIMNN